jgi:hypothetical protein
MSREQIESRIVVPRHTIFLQIFPLYILPVIIIVAGYFFFSLLGFCNEIRVAACHPFCLMPPACAQARAARSPDAHHQTEWHGSSGVKLIHRLALKEACGRGETD